MRFKPKGDEFEPLAGVNIIPVIDVSLVLLIILLATSPILDVPGFEVKLPKAKTAESKEKNITVSLSTKDEMAVNTAKATDTNQVEALVRQEIKKSGQPDIMVIIRADQGVPYGKVENLMDVAKQAGAKRIAIATQQIEPGASAATGAPTP